METLTVQLETAREAIARQCRAALDAPVAAPRPFSRRTAAVRV
jgi:hypothetical protein